MENLNAKGTEGFDAAQKSAFDRIAGSYYSKISRKLKNDFAIRIVVKDYQTAGRGKREIRKKARKYSIRIFVITSVKKLEAHAADWDLNRTLHAVFEKILSEIEHMFHVSEQGRE